VAGPSLVHHRPGRRDHWTQNSLHSGEHETPALPLVNAEPVCTRLDEPRDGLVDALLRVSGRRARRPRRSPRSRLDERADGTHSKMIRSPSMPTPESCVLQVSPGLNRQSGGEVPVVTISPAWTVSN